MTMPTILFVHGMWGHSAVWHRWQDRFQHSGFITEALTLPGHACRDNDATIGELRLDDYVGSVLSWMDACASPPVLVGHSLGGLVIQLAAMRRPAAALVLVSGSVPAAVNSQRLSNMIGFSRNMVKWASWRRPFRLSNWEATFLLLNRMPPQSHEGILANMRAESGRVVWEIGNGRLNWTNSNRVDRDAIHCPILSFAGRQDRAVPVGVARAMAKWYGSRLEHREFADHAHWMLEEPGWEDRADEVCLWLRQKLPY